jgi:hypothetical protein
MTFNLVNKYLLVLTWALFCGQNSQSGDMNDMSERVILHGALTAKIIDLPGSSNTQHEAKKRTPVQQKAVIP